MTEHDHQPWPDDAALSRVNESLAALIGSEDVREGVLAMVQKRAPAFKGR